MRATKTPVLGQVIELPRLTPRGWRLLALWLAPPALAFILLADLIGHAIAVAFFNTCSGLLCLAG
jgi:hypothetical protein